MRDADLVIFLDKGRIVEMGGFAELSARNGRFASLLRAGGLLTDEEVRRVSRIAVEAAGGVGFGLPAIHAAVGAIAASRQRGLCSFA